MNKKKNIKLSVCGFMTFAFCGIICSLASSCSSIVAPDIEISGDEHFKWDCVGEISTIQITWKNFYSNYVTAPILKFENENKEFNSYFSCVNNVKSQYTWTFIYKCIQTGNTISSDIENIQITEYINKYDAFYKTITTNDAACGMNFVSKGVLNTDADPSYYLSDENLKIPKTDGNQYNTIDVLQSGYINDNHDTKWLSSNILMADLCYTLQRIKTNLLNAVVFHIPIIDNLSITNLDSLQIQYDLSYAFDTQIFDYLNIHITGHPEINTYFSSTLDFNISLHNYSVIGAFEVNNTYKQDTGSYHNDYKNDDILSKDKFISLVPNDLSSFTQTSVTFGVSLFGFNLNIKESFVNWMQNFGIIGFDRFSSPDGYWYNALGAFQEQSFYIDSYWLKNIPTMYPCNISDSSLYTQDPQYKNEYDVRNKFVSNFEGYAPTNNYSSTIFPAEHNLLYKVGKNIDGSEMTPINTDGYDWSIDGGNHQQVVQKWDSMIKNNNYRSIQVNSGVDGHTSFPYYKILNSLFCEPNDTDGEVKHNIMLINPVFGWDADLPQLRCDNFSSVTFTS